MRTGHTINLITTVKALQIHPKAIRYQEITFAPNLIDLTHIPLLKGEIHLLQRDPMKAIHPHVVHLVQGVAMRLQGVHLPVLAEIRHPAQATIHHQAQEVVAK